MCTATIGKFWLKDTTEAGLLALLARRKTNPGYTAHERDDGVQRITKELTFREEQRAKEAAAAAAQATH